VGLGVEPVDHDVERLVPGVDPGREVHHRPGRDPAEDQRGDDRPDRVNPRRAYRSPTRERQRAATRAAIVEVASRYFAERGYVGTTVTAIAEGADLSPESVYVIFKTKREVLRAAVEAAASGDGTAEGVVRREWLERLRAEPDQRRRFAIMTDATRETLRRAAPMDEVVRVTATTDPEIAAMQREYDQQRLQDIRLLVGLLEDAGPLRMPAREAADLMWAVTRSTDFYRALTVDRRWAHTRAFDALNELLARLLLPD
jgi:AcrR family transcriptional regulator